MPAPHLPAGPIVLRVAHAVNPRLPRFSDAQLEQMLEAARDTAERFFGVRVSFERAGTIEIETLFREIPPDVWAEFQKATVPLGGGKTDISAFVRSTYDQLRADGLSADAVRRFASLPGTAAPDTRNLEALTKALVAHQIQGLTTWRAALARDGRPVLGNEPYHEWMAWSALEYGRLPFDVVITNQLVASAEHAGNAIHTMLRVGVSIGTTFYSRAGPLGTYVMLSTFMFSDELPSAVVMRGDGAYTEPEAAVLAGAYLAHELGHQLMHLGHPYANDSCVMRPAVMFQFREWHARLDPARCRVGSEPPMEVGAVSLRYDRRFAR